MSIERFSKAQFEAALPKDKVTGDALWQCLGLVKGEFVYTVPLKVAGITTTHRLVIRSTVDALGLSADTGKDSIRMLIEYYHVTAKKWQPLKKHDTDHTTRVRGWERRMTDKLKELYQAMLDDWNAHGRRVMPQEQPQPTEETEPEQPQAGFDFSFIQPARVQAVQPIPPLQGNFDPTQFERGFDRQPNAAQRQAICSQVDGAYCWQAGPGAGKTWTVKHRVRYLLANGVDPKNLIVVCFNAKMAAEMLTKINAACPQVIDEQISTIHAMCWRMLKAEGDKRMVCAGKVGWKAKAALEEIIEDLWPYADERPGWAELGAWVDMPKHHGLTSNEDFEFYQRALGPFAHLAGKLHDARKLFDGRMKQEGLITFSDMPYEVEQKLKRDATFRAKWQALYRYVIVDEGQDTNRQAMRILSYFGNNFSIVGDIDQLLYRFTGATPEANLLDGFETGYNGEMIFFPTNYRSTQAIVAAGRRLISSNYQYSGGPIGQRFFKDLTARDDAPEGEPISWHWYASPEDEAQGTVQTIVEQLANGYEPGDFFVGARTRAQLAYLEGYLVRANVPYINITGGSFWTLSHVAKSIAYLRLAVDTANSKALEQVYNVPSNNFVSPFGKSKGEYVPHRYLGRAFLDACKSSFARIWEAVDSKRSSRGYSSYEDGVLDLEQFINEIKSELATASNMGEALQYIIDGAIAKWLKHSEGIVVADAAEDGKLEDLGVLVELASQYETSEEFFAQVDVMVAADEAAKSQDWGKYVVLSTVHRLKGLERKVVLGIGWSEGEDKNGNPRGLLPHTFSLTEPPQQGALPAGGKGRIEDERCIAYVLITRAQERVFLSGCASYRMAQMSPSRFAHELGLLDEMPSRVASDDKVEYYEAMEGKDV